MSKGKSKNTSNNKEDSMAPPEIPQNNEYSNAAESQENYLKGMLVQLFEKHKEEMNRLFQELQNNAHKWIEAIERNRKPQANRQREWLNLFNTWKQNLSQLTEHKLRKS